MGWDTILRIIGCVGGAGAIIVFCSKLAANHISERMLQKYDANLQKDIEHYKHELEMETEKYRKKSENLTFVTRKQFETEFSAYQTIFDNLFTFGSCTSILFPILDKLPDDKEKVKEIYKKRYKDFCDAYNNFSETLEKNAPFIPEKHYDMFISIRNLAHKIGCMYPDIRIYDDSAYKNDFKLQNQNYQETIEFENKITIAKKTIREYLATLKVDKE